MVVTVWPFFYLKFVKIMEENGQQSQPVPPSKTVKEFLEYPDLVKTLKDRGMLIADEARCQRKIAQVGYYRLSGYWHSARTFKRNGFDIQYDNTFQRGTSFDDAFSFYLFDKAMRQEFLSALERIEIYFRTIIAHEIGRVDPLAYKNKYLFSKNSFDKNKKGHNYDDWNDRHDALLKDSKEDSISSHIAKDKPIPIWVAAEAWDFGTMAKFYSMLKDNYKDTICNRVGIDKREVLDNWLINLNGLRNRCAHHSRLCNRPSPRTFMLPKKGYFNLLQLSRSECEKLFGAISVIWFLVKIIGPSSKWLHRVADLIDTKPNIPGFFYSSMGFPREAVGFPRERFVELQSKTVAVSDAVEPQSLSEKKLIEGLELKLGLSMDDNALLSERAFGISCAYEKLEKKDDKSE
jgi:abortive infection bacteriophage resistance protein